MYKFDNCTVNLKFKDYVEDTRSDLESMISCFSCSYPDLVETKETIERGYNSCMDSIKTRSNELINIACFLSGAEVISIDECCKNCSYIHSIYEDLYRWVAKVYVDKVRCLSEY